VDLYADLDALPRGARLAVTVGVFDGMHRGHARLLRSLVRAGRRWQAEPTVVTFEPHPDAVLRGAAPPLLCDPTERLAWLALAGVRHTVLQRFDAAFAAQTPEQFLARLQAGRTLAGLVMSPESAIGRGRAGTPERLRELGKRDGFAVEVIAAVKAGSGLISASRIREALAAGRLRAARQMLGRDPAVIGRVVRGDARGRLLGYPTANLAFDAPVALPADGIYAVEASWGGPDPLHPSRSAGGVASLGVRPTFEPGARTLEVYLFEVDEDLYGAQLRVAFVRRQRAERRFASAAALMAQMDRDAARARAILAARAGRRAGVGELSVRGRRLEDEGPLVPAWVAGGGEGRPTSVLRPR
jgi:riboflavin kinase/FMN adenylyltransferase